MRQQIFAQTCGAYVRAKLVRCYRSVLLTRDVAVTSGCAQAAKPFEEGRRNQRSRCKSADGLEIEADQALLKVQRASFHA
jgi:hypothetical protein